MGSKAVGLDSPPPKLSQCWSQCHCATVRLWEEAMAEHARKSAV